MSLQGSGFCPQPCPVNDFTGDSKEHVCNDREKYTCETRNDRKLGERRCMLGNKIRIRNEADRLGNECTILNLTGINIKSQF